MRWCLLGVLGLGIVSLTGITAREPADQKEARWLTDYDQARKTARNSNKPIFVVFR